MNIQNDKKTKHPKKIKDKNVNVKFPEEDVEILREIAESLGGMPISTMLRTLIYSRMEEVKKSGDPQMFFTTNKKSKG